MNDWSEGIGFDEVAKGIFRVETSYIGEEGEVCKASATAFSLAIALQSKRLVLATAAHVVDFPVSTGVEWKIQQFNVAGDLVRERRYHTEMPGDNFGRHLKSDVAWICPPARGVDGVEFIASTEQAMFMIDTKIGVSEGTRVSWAGFPYQVERFLGRPQLCFFDGIVSAMVQKPHPIYIVDGHAARGVSGGPVWHWSSERNALEVVGIVSKYGGADDGIPGFCIFEPINYVRALFESWIEEGKWKRA
jgi:hypothetical protein